MNYLAHTVLSCHSPEAIVGSLLGDFVKGAVPAHYIGEIGRAIQAHRAIDRFTDAHDMHRASRAVISPARRRFAGILVDVFYDHFLVRHWSRFGPEPLDAFTGRVYETLKAYEPMLPDRLQRMLPYMSGDDWLGSYGEMDSVEAALHGIARRFRRFPRAMVLLDGIEELERGYSALEMHFLRFFPDAQIFSRGASEEK